MLQSQMLDIRYEILDMRNNVYFAAIIRNLMKLHILIPVLFCGLIAAGCGNKPVTTEPTPAVEETAKPGETDFPTFWTAFRSAVLENKMDEIKKRTQFPLATQGEMDGDPIIYYSENEFDVKILNNKLKVNKTESNNKSVLKIPNGTLVGSNHGEWGGKLIFIPDGKNQSEIVIKEGNLKFVFLFQNNIYFIEGLAHGSFNYGDLQQLNYSENKFTYKSIIHFEDSPEAFSIYKNKIYIVGYQNFYRIDNLKKEVIFKDAFWSGLYPNTIAIIDEKNVFLGIRSGIAKLNLPQRQIVYYKYIKQQA